MASRSREERSYDDLGPEEQSFVRAEWSARMVALRRDLDLSQRFAASSRSWVELDDSGRVVERRGGEGSSTPRSS